eukprot:1772381-Rhodomonas_salina.1
MRHHFVVDEPPRHLLRRQRPLHLPIEVRAARNRCPRHTRVPYVSGYAFAPANALPLHSRPCALAETRNAHADAIRQRALEVLRLRAPFALGSLPFVANCVWARRETETERERQRERDRERQREIDR